MLRRSAMLRQHFRDAVGRITAGVVALRFAPLEDDPQTLEDAAGRGRAREPVRTDGREDVAGRHVIDALRADRREHRGE